MSGISSSPSSPSDKPTSHPIYPIIGNDNNSQNPDMTPSSNSSSSLNSHGVADDEHQQGKKSSNASTELTASRSVPNVTMTTTTTPQNSSDSITTAGRPYHFITSLWYQKKWSRQQSMLQIDDLCLRWNCWDASTTHDPSSSSSPPENASSQNNSESYQDGTELNASSSVLGSDDEDDEEQLLATTTDLPSSTTTTPNLPSQEPNDFSSATTTKKRKSNLHVDTASESSPQSDTSSFGTGTGRNAFAPSLVGQASNLRSISNNDGGAPADPLSSSTSSSATSSLTSSPRSLQNSMTPSPLPPSSLSTSIFESLTKSFSSAFDAVKSKTRWGDAEGGALVDNTAAALSSSHVLHPQMSQNASHTPLLARSMIENTSRSSRSSKVANHQENKPTSSVPSLKRRNSTSNLQHSTTSLPSSPVNQRNNSTPLSHQLYRHNYNLAGTNLSIDSLPSVTIYLPEIRSVQVTQNMVTIYLKNTKMVKFMVMDPSTILQKQLSHSPLPQEGTAESTNDIDSQQYNGDSPSNSRGSASSGCGMLPTQSLNSSIVDRGSIESSTSSLGGVQYRGSSSSNMSIYSASGTTGLNSRIIVLPVTASNNPVSIWLASKLKKIIKHKIRKQKFVCIHTSASEDPQTHQDSNTTDDTHVPSLSYDICREFTRQGVLKQTNDDASQIAEWRVSTANMKFDVCGSYPQLNVVPYLLSDEELRKAAPLRAHSRFPMLAWACSKTGVSISRAAQPCYGLSLFSSNAALEDDQHVLKCINATNPHSARLAVVDLRSKLAANANRIKGYGFEIDYADVDLYFQNIGNIHAVRSSYFKVMDLVQSTGGNSPQWLSLLEKSQWLEFTVLLLQTAEFCKNLLVEDKTSCLCHCSDSWDRSSQVISLVMLMMDPYYRTLEGFAILIRKEWIDTGHLWKTRNLMGSYSPKSSQYSPIFFQFVEALVQLTKKYPNAFEFNEEFLLELADAIYSGRFVDFLANSSQERLLLPSWAPSLFQHVIHPSRRERYTNPNYSVHNEVLSATVRYCDVDLWKNWWLRFVDYY